MKIGEATYPAGSYVIKRNQPYGRLAKILLEQQETIPDESLQTYDDSGWTMGLMLQTDVEPIDDAAILKVDTSPVDQVALGGHGERQGFAGRTTPWPTTARRTWSRSATG